MPGTKITGAGYRVAMPGLFLSDFEEMVEDFRVKILIEALLTASQGPIGDSGSPAQLA